MAFKPSRIIVAGVLAGLASGCASLGGNKQAEDRQARLEERVERIERVMGNQSLMDMAQRIDRMEQDVRELRGQVERLQHELEGARERQRDLYLDLDRRLQALETGKVATGTPSPDGGAGEEPPEAGATNAGDAYRAAFKLLKEGRYDKAEKAFSGFLEQYRDSEYADNAQYWLGEARYVTQDFESAVDAFRRVLDDYPDSNKAADALLKLGYCHYELQQWSKARDALEQVREEHPDTTAANLAGTRLDRMRQEGH